MDVGERERERERDDVACSSFPTGVVVGEGAKRARDAMEREEG